MPGPTILPVRNALKLPTSPRMALFRLIDQRLRADPTLERTVKEWRSWQGVPDDAKPFGQGQLPAVRLTPRSGPEGWWASDSQKGTLFVMAEVITPGLCADDLDNLWFAIERALYPVDPAARNAWVATLQAAGAWKGLVQLAQPAFDGRPEMGGDGRLDGQGMLSIEFRINANS